MQTALLHILPVPGSAQTATHNAAASSAPTSGVPVDFGEALSNAANDLSAPDAGAAGSVAVRTRRGVARGEPAHAARDEAGTSTPKAATVAAADQRPGGAEPSQPVEPASYEDLAIEAPQGAGVASGVTPWLAAMVASTAVPGAAAKAEAAPANAAADVAAGKPLQAGKRADQHRNAAAASLSAPRPEVAQEPIRTVASEGGADPGPRTAARRGTGDRPQWTADRSTLPTTDSRPHAEKSSPVAEVAARKGTEAAPLREVVPAAGESAGASRTQGRGGHVLTVQVGGEKANIELAPATATEAAGRIPSATASSQRTPQSPTRAGTVQAVPGPAGRGSPGQEHAADPAAATARRSAGPAAGRREEPTPAAHALNGTSGRQRAPSVDTTGRVPAVATAPANGPAASSVRPADEGTRAGHADRLSALPRPGTAEAESAVPSVPTSPAPGLRRTAGTPAPRDGVQDAAGAGRLPAAAPEARPTDPSQGLDIGRRQPLQRGVPGSPEGEVLAGRDRTAPTMEVAAAEVSKVAAQQTTLTPGVGEVTRAIAAMAQSSDASTSRDTAASGAVGLAAAAQGSGAGGVATVERPAVASTPARADAVRARASQSGTAAAGMARGRSEGSVEGSEGAASADAPSSSARRANSSAALPTTVPTGTGQAAAAPSPAAPTAPMTASAQVGPAVAAAEPYRRYVLPQGQAADSATGAARTGAAGLAGLEAARQRRALAGTDTEQALRRSAPEAAAAPAETQAAAWIRALEAAAGSPVGRESRIDDVALAGPGAPIAQESGAAEGRGATATQEASTTAARIDAALNSPEFAPLLGARIAALVRDGIEQARIALNPQEMGPVSVQLALDGSKVSVELAAEVEATRLALELALPSLAGALHEAGFTLAGGGVFQQSRDSGGGTSPQEGGAWSERGTAAAQGDARSTAVPTRTPRERTPRGLVDLYA